MRCISPSVVGARRLHSTLASDDQTFEYRISRYQITIAFAGGAVTGGVWGSKRRVAGFSVHTDEVNYLNLLCFLYIERHSYSLMLVVTGKICVPAAFMNLDKL